VSLVSIGGAEWARLSRIWIRQSFCEIEEEIGEANELVGRAVARIEDRLVAG
jgi:hypothetical protein